MCGRLCVLQCTSHAILIAVACELFLRPAATLVDLIDNLGDGVVDVGKFGGLRDAHMLLMDEVDQFMALCVWHRLVLFGHPYW